SCHATEKRDELPPPHVSLIDGSHPTILVGREPRYVHHSKTGVPRSGVGLVSRVSPVQTALRNCTRDEGRSFEVGNQVLISSRRKLLLSKAMVVNVAETSGLDSGRQG